MDRFLPDYTKWEMTRRARFLNWMLRVLTICQSSIRRVKLSVWDFSLTRALSMMRRTAPNILFRVLVYFGIACAYLIVAGASAGIGYGMGAFGDEDFRLGAAFCGAIAGFGVTAGAIYLLREYLLYIVKAGHIAVLVELIDGRDLPPGQWAFLRIAVGFVDEVILAHAIRSRADHPSAAAEESLVLYAQNGRIMLKNAA